MGFSVEAEIERPVTVVSAFPRLLNINSILRLSSLAGKPKSRIEGDTEIRFSGEVHLREHSIYLDALRYIFQQDCPLRLRYPIVLFYLVDCQSGFAASIRA